MNSERAVALAIALVIAATVVGIYTENKSTQAISQPGSPNYRRGRPLANNQSK